MKVKYKILLEVESIWPWCKKYSLSYLNEYNYYTTATCGSLYKCEKMFSDIKNGLRARDGSWIVTELEIDIQN